MGQHGDVGLCLAVLRGGGYAGLWLVSLHLCQPLRGQGFNRAQVADTVHLGAASGACSDDDRVARAGIRSGWPEPLCERNRVSASVLCLGGLYSGGGGHGIFPEAEGEYEGEAGGVRLSGLFPGAALSWRSSSADDEGHGGNLAIYGGVHGYGLCENAADPDILRPHDRT